MILTSLQIIKRRVDIQETKIMPATAVEENRMNDERRVENCQIKTLQPTKTHIYQVMMNQIMKEYQRELDNREQQFINSVAHLNKAIHKLSRVSPMHPQYRDDLRNIALTATPKVFQSLIQSNWIDSKGILLIFKDVDDETMRQILHGNWPNLVNLTLENSRFCAQSLQNIAYTNWNFLTDLNLSCNNVGSIGIKYLTKASFYFLQFLSLRQTKFNNEAAYNLSKNTYSKLKGINIRDNKYIGNAGIRHLLKSDWKKLQILNFALPVEDQNVLAGLHKADFKLRKITVEVKSHERHRVNHLRGNFLYVLDSFFTKKYPKANRHFLRNP